MLRRFCAFVALLASLLLAPAAAQAAVTHAASASIAGTGSASATLTVPAGSNRYLLVGVSTLESATVTSVTYGAQVLTREIQSAKDSSRAEVWTLKAPNAGTADVTVTVTGNAPLVMGASTFTGVDQTLPILTSASHNENNSSNSASLVLSGTVVDDGMFGVISINDAPNITAINSTPSTDTVAAVRRWGGVQGTVLGAGATRGGNTGQNMALNTGINWFWNRIDPSRLMPYSNILVGLRQATAAPTTPPTVSTPTATAITHDSAILGGSVTDTGGEPVTQRGVVYCAGACTPVLGGGGVTAKTAGAGDVGAFSVDATGLTPSTTYTFRAFATNANGTSYTASTPFTTSPQPNRAPTANAGGPYAIAEGDGLTLSGSGTDADGDPLTYAWDLDGDGTYGDVTGAAPTLTAAQLGTLGLGDGPKTASVRVRVSDGTLSTTSAPASVTVSNVAPSATLTGNGPVDEGGIARVSWAGVTDLSAADAAAGTRYAYDFDNDGTWDLGGATYGTASTSATADLPASLTADGDRDRTVRAAVIDKDSGVREYTTKIEVDNVAPTAKLTGATVDEGTPATVTFGDQHDVSAADEAAGFTYEFDLDGDGVFEVKGTDSKATLKTTDGPATLPVKAAILDKDGGRREYTTTVVVRNVAPTVTIAGADSGTVGQAIALTLTGADAGGDALTGTVSWGDGTTDAYAATVSHTYGAAGAYSVTVTLRDKDGGETVAQHAITVAPAPAPPAVPAPAPNTGVLGVEATNLTLSGLRVTPRCIRAAGLRAVASAAKTIKVQFRTSAAADVTFRLRRLDGKGGASKCPPATGVAQKGGRKVPGVYSPFSHRAVQAKSGLNTVTLAATTAKGKALKPGTYLLTITAGDVTARTKVWVLAR